MRGRAGAGGGLCAWLGAGAAAPDCPRGARGVGAGWMSIGAGSGESLSADAGAAAFGLAALGAFAAGESLALGVADVGCAGGTVVRPSSTSNFLDCCSTARSASQRGT